MLTFVCIVMAGISSVHAGFGLCGIPETLITALARRKDVNNLTAVSNNAGTQLLSLFPLSDLMG